MNEYIGGSFSVYRPMTLSIDGLDDSKSLDKLMYLNGSVDG
jgi:hypothetical protein